MGNLCKSVGGKNVGKPLCDDPLASLQTLMITQSFELTAEELEDEELLEAAFKAAAMLPNGDPNKVYILPVAHDVVNNTGDPSEQTFPSGLTQINTTPLPRYSLSFVIGPCQAKALAAFNGFSGKGYVRNSDGKLDYVAKPDGGGKGFTIAQLFTNLPAWSAIDGRREVVSRVSFGNAAEFADLFSETAARFDPQSLVNLVNVNLKQVAAASGDVFTIGGETDCVRTNIYTSYKTPLNNADAWLVTRADTGAVVEVESVATDDVNGGWDITIATGVTTGTKLLIQFVSPGELADLTTPVLGIEAVPLKVVKAA